MCLARIVPLRFSPPQQASVGEFRFGSRPSRVVIGNEKSACRLESHELHHPGESHGDSGHWRVLRHRSAEGLPSESISAGLLAGWRKRNRNRHPSGLVLTFNKSARAITAARSVSDRKSVV